MTSSDAYRERSTTDFDREAVCNVLRQRIYDLVDSDGIVLRPGSDGIHFSSENVSGMVVMKKTAFSGDPYIYEIKTSDGASHGLLLESPFVFPSENNVSCLSKHIPTDAQFEVTSYSETSARLQGMYPHGSVSVTSSSATS
jgi:hypothetical protein